MIYVIIAIVADIILMLYAIVKNMPAARLAITFMWAFLQGETSSYFFIIQNPVYGYISTGVAVLVYYLLYRQFKIKRKTNK